MRVLCAGVYLYCQHGKRTICGFLARRLMRVRSSARVVVWYRQMIIWCIALTGCIDMSADNLDKSAEVYKQLARECNDLDILAYVYKQML